MNVRLDRWLEFLVVWLLAASALGMLAALAGHFLAPQICLASLLVTGIYARYTNDTVATSQLAPDWGHLALLTLVCLFFRLPAYHYVLGGQDEGVYVNIAHHIARTGGIEVRDSVLEKLDVPSLANTYLSQNRGANYIPGVYALDASGPRLEFQFYHLFPVWMALFDGVFGIDFAVYALTFFSWLSVLFFYRLALAVSGCRRSALLAGVLLALNPLHAFFSKFPVTEVPTLAFSLIGFSYLVMFRGAAQSSRSRWLWISVASFGCLFVTRISGFMYMPFVLAAAITAAVADGQAPLRRAMFLWCAGIVALYALSVGYGLHWSGAYARDIYRMSFERIFHDQWRAGAMASGLIGIAIWLAISATVKSEQSRKQVRRYLVTPVRQAVAVCVILALLVGCFRIYQLGWTDRYGNDAWLGGTWHLAGSGETAIKASSLFALCVYLGPLLPVGLFALLRRQGDPNVEFLRVFAAGFVVYVALLQWNVPYGPYYARYLLSEVVPYLLLLAVWQLTSTERQGNLWGKGVLALFGVSALYMLVATAAQLGKNENAGLYEELRRLLAPVDADDLVLITPLKSGFAASRIQTPVVYTFGRRIINVSEESLKDNAYMAALDARFDDVFLLTSEASAPCEFDWLGSTRLKIWAFAFSYFYPRKIALTASERLYLYRRQSGLPLSCVQDFDQRGAWNRWLSRGWNAPESWGTWSEGRHAELVIDTSQLPKASSGLRLHFQANALVNAVHPRQRIEVKLNGATVGLREVAFPQSTVGFDVDISPDILAASRRLNIAFELPDAVSPAAIGMGDDSRVVALGLRSVEAIPLVADAQSPATSAMDHGKSRR